MKKILTAIFSLFTISIFIVTMMFTSKYSAEALNATVTPSDTITVYFDNSYTNWMK